jgi:hypothetical protein
MRGLEVGSAGFEPQMHWHDEATLERCAVISAIPALRGCGTSPTVFAPVSRSTSYTNYSGGRPVVPGADQDLVREETALPTGRWRAWRHAELRRLKRKGFSDRRLADLLGASERAVRECRHALGIRPVYKRVDTCAGEFASATAYMYSTYEEECEAAPSARDKIMVLGGGPNRIGQGIEFDYCCVHAALAMREDGYETIMVNCNPETVSTDYDTSDRLYFEPVTLEDVLEIVHVEQPKGVIVQFGGQTPLKLARALYAAGRADHRHHAGCDRPRRGPRALPADDRETGSVAAGKRDRALGGRGRGRPDASVTRWWCGLRTCSAGARWKSCTGRGTAFLHARGGAGFGRFADPARPVPARGDRGRYRRGQRRRARW